MAIARPMLAFVMVAALCASVAHAHGGGFHGWTWDSPDHNFTRVLLATAGNFSLYDASTSSLFTPGDIPFFPSYGVPATITGSVTVWEYLDASCRETAGLAITINVTSGKKPVSHEKVYFWGMTGKCAAGVQDTYKHNLTMGSARGNMLWAATEENVSNENGTISGTAPNIFYPRSMASADGPALTSILVSFAPDVSPFLCADLKWNTIDASAWATQLKNCKPSGADAHGRKMLA